MFLYLCTSYVYLLVTTANKTLYSLANVSLGTSLLICVEGELSAPRILDTVAPLFLREFQLRSLLPTLPSLSETFGAVVNEALIFGLPVFCSKYAGASSLIQSHNGVVFDPLNEKTTNEKLNHFLGWTENFDEIDITNRPSLMLDYKEVFIKEWRKLVYA